MVYKFHSFLNAFFQSPKSSRPHFWHDILVFSAHKDLRLTFDKFNSSHFDKGIGDISLGPCDGMQNSHHNVIRKLSKLLKIELEPAEPSRRFFSRQINIHC